MRGGALRGGPALGKGRAWPERKRVKDTWPRETLAVGSRQWRYGQSCKPVSATPLQVLGSRSHQARNVWLWKSAFCFAAPSEPQTPPEATRT